MHISCPHCNAAYNIGPVIKNAVLVCHRCHTEFNMGDEVRKQQEERDAATNEASLPLFDHLSREENPSTQASEPESATTAAHAETADKPKKRSGASSIPVPAFLAGKNDYAEEVKALIKPAPNTVQGPESTGKNSDEAVASDRPIEPELMDLQAPHEESEDRAAETAMEASNDSELEPADEVIVAAEMFEPTPPARQEIAIWPWLVVILLIISGAGFYYKQDVWLDHPWVRSVLINLYLPVTVRDKDWVIVPESVQGNWLKRDDGSQVLIIQGRIENRLYCELSPPKMLVRFFDESGINESLEERVMPITEPPSMEKVKHAPFVTPGLDRIAVEAQGQRGFFLVVESLPDQAADFTLKPVAN